MGLDQALHGDGEIGGRAVGHHVRDVAERVLMDVEAGVAGGVDLPVRDILAVMAAGRHAQDLDHAGGGRIVAVGGGMKDFQAHGSASMLEMGTIAKAISAVMPELDLAGCVSPGHSGPPRRGEPGISRFGVRCFASPRNDGARWTTSSSIKPDTAP